MSQQNLFPQHLLVDVNDNHTFTTSLKIAEHFHKRHSDVVKKVRHKKFCSEYFNARNFARVNYIDKKGETREMYRMTKDGFMFLVMGFTGKNAIKWKEDFIEEFNLMDDFISGRTTRFADALYQVRPYLKPIVEGTEKGLSRTEIGEPLGKSLDSITYHRQQAKRFGLLPEKVSA